MEKMHKPISGFVAVFVVLLLLVAATWLFILAKREGSNSYLIYAILSILTASFLSAGIFVISPNHARVLTFFGKYIGTAKKNGLMFVNPFFKKQGISLRSENLESAKLKVNDKMGNPIEIAAVIVWQVSDTYKAIFDVEDYDHFVKVQSEAAVRHLALSCPYDHMEDEHATITLREGGEIVNTLLEQELHDRLGPAGIIIKEARISHLAYAAEIAGAMLQRQQATAIVAARSKIVEGAVGMVEMALEMLSRKGIVTLDEEKKAAMVSNLMVVLCGEKGATPILNTGTLYQ